MGLFRKRICPLCGGKVGVISYSLAGGEKICTGCEMLLRGRYDLARRGASFHDTLADLDGYRAKRLIDEMKTMQREDIAALSGRYAAVIGVLETFSVPSFGLEEGGSAIAALGGKPVALGFCEYGVFSQGDRVIVLDGEGERTTAVLKLIPCTGAYPFEEYLIDDSHSRKCEADTNAWLILDLDPAAIAPGCKIVKE